MVALKDEVTHLQNMIPIHQLRFMASSGSHSPFPGDWTAPWSFPSCLSTGWRTPSNTESSRPDAPVQITLLCDDLSKRSFFQSATGKREGPKETSTGYRVGHTISRLKWMYADNYSFRITDEPYYFLKQN